MVDVEWNVHAQDMESRAPVSSIFSAHFRGTHGVIVPYDMSWAQGLLPERTEILCREVLVTTHTLDTFRFLLSHPPSHPSEMSSQ